MKAMIKIVKEVEIKTLYVSADVRYWEDATVNGVEDTDGTLIPCRNGDNWEPVIDIDTGQILNWVKGTTANVHYKICDAGIYTLEDADGKAVLTHEGYVRNILECGAEGYGDYIIMDIDANGFIQHWKQDLSDWDGIGNDDE